MSDLAKNRSNRATDWVPPDANRRLKSVDRIAALLNGFTDQRPSMTLTEAAELLGLHKSSASRLLRQLADTGLLHRLDDGQRYAVGVRLFEIGNLYTSSNDFIRVSDPFLQRLVQATGHTAQLCVPDDFESVVVASEESRELIRAAANLGGRLPAMTTASGRVFLAHRTDEEIHDHWAETSPDRRPARDHLLAAIARIRQDGICVVVGGYRPEILSLAAPVYGPGRVLRGALCLVMPNTEHARASLDACRRATTDLARELSARLGHAPS